MAVAVTRRRVRRRAKTLSRAARAGAARSRSASRVAARAASPAARTSPRRSGAPNTGAADRRRAAAARLACTAAGAPGSLSRTSFHYCTADSNVFDGRSLPAPYHLPTINKCYTPSVSWQMPPAGTKRASRAPSNQLSRSTLAAKGCSSRKNGARLPTESESSRTRLRLSISRTESDTSSVDSSYKKECPSGCIANRQSERRVKHCIHTANT